MFELFFSPWLTEVDCALRREVGVVLVQVVTALSCIIAFCLNYTIFLNTTLNSALTQTMCGNLKVKCFFLWLKMRMSTGCLRSRKVTQEKLPNNMELDSRILSPLNWVNGKSLCGVIFYGFRSAHCARYCDGGLPGFGHSFFWLDLFWWPSIWLGTQLLSIPLGLHRKFLDWFAL